MTKKIFLSFFLLLIFGSCVSTKKYNANLEQPISVQNQIQDIDYVQNQLNDWYPNLYGYIAEKDLNFKFDSLRKTIQKPQTSKEFYFGISTVVASVRQGHMSMYPAAQRFSKQEQKKFKKDGTGPLSQFKFEYQNDTMFIAKNKSKYKSIKEGLEVVSINGIEPQKLHNKYQKTITSDGLNTTFLPVFFSKRYNAFMTNEIGVHDSLTYVFRSKDSVFSQVVYRKNLDKKFKASNDSVAKVAPKKEAKISKAEKKKNKIYGYDKDEKVFSKELNFVGKDKDIAHLKIRNFTKGNYYKAYNLLFDSINKCNAKALIIDLRDNGGGRMAEINDLYSHLTDKKFALTKPSIVKSKTSMWRTGILQKAPIYTYPLIAVGYPIFMGISYFKARKIAPQQYQFTKKQKFEKPVDEPFTKKMYVLINGGSFSASCVISSALKANPDITFVGEETGGAFNFTTAGFMPIKTLPNSKVKMRLGLVDIQSYNQTDVAGHGIYPDVTIKQTLQDEINKKDPQLDWILADLEK